MVPLYHKSDPGTISYIAASILTMLSLAIMGFFLNRAFSNIRPIQKTDGSRLVALTACIITIFFHITMAGLVTSVDINSTEPQCRALYCIMAFFWIPIKALVHVWMNEKLYQRRAALDLERNRSNVFYYLNMLTTLIPLAISLTSAGRLRSTPIKNGTCHFEITNKAGILCLLVVLAISAIYTSISFAHPCASHNRRKSAVFPFHLGIWPPPSKKAILWGRKLITIFGFLNVATTIIPLAGLTLLVVFSGVTPWYIPVSMAMSDVTMCTLITLMSEGKVNRTERVPGQSKKIRARPYPRLDLSDSCRNCGRLGSFGISFEDFAATTTLKLPAGL